MCSWKECGGKLWWRIEVRHEMIENRHRKKRDEVIENRHEVAKDQIQISWDIPSEQPEERCSRVRYNEMQNTRVYRRKRQRTTWDHLKSCEMRVGEKGNTLGMVWGPWKAHQLKSIICPSSTSVDTISGCADLVYGPHLEFRAFIRCVLSCHQFTSPTGSLEMSFTTSRRSSFASRSIQEDNECVARERKRRY